MLQKPAVWDSVVAGQLSDPSCTHRSHWTPSWCTHPLRDMFRRPPGKSTHSRWCVYTVLPWTGLGSSGSGDYHVMLVPIFFYSHTKSMMLNMPHKNQYNLPSCYNNSRLRQWLVYCVGWFLYYGPHVAFILEKHVIRCWTGALIWQWLWSGHYRMRLSPRLLSSFPALVTRGKVCFATRWTRIIWWLGLLRHLQQWRHWAEWIYPPAAPASKFFSYLNLSWNWLPQGKLQGSVILLLLLTSQPLTTRMPWLSTTSRPDWPKF